MEYVTISGAAQLRASRIGLGTRALGSVNDAPESAGRAEQVILSALDSGITLIDTAPAWGFGRSEELVGKVLKESGRRKDVVLATRAGLEWPQGSLRRNASRRRIVKELDDSLRRLRTDVIDLYQVHWPDPKVPAEETAGAMQDLYQEGKIRAIGVCNFTAEEMDSFRETAPLHSAAPSYNLFERFAECGVVPYCREEGIVLISNGTFCRGLLAGTGGAPCGEAGGALLRSDPKLQGPLHEQYLTAVRILDEFARRRYGRGVLQLAMRWTLDMGADIALCEAPDHGQLALLPGVFGWTLDDDAKREIDTIVAENVPVPTGTGESAPPA